MICPLLEAISYRLRRHFGYRVLALTESDVVLFIPKYPLPVIQTPEAAPAPTVQLLSQIPMGALVQ